MPEIPIIMPQLGESIAEATIVTIAVKPGEEVAADQDILEVETNKAGMSVTTPCPGRVEQLLVEIQQRYPVGAILGYLDVSDHEYDIVVHSLNELFAERHQNHPLAYARDSSPSTWNDSRPTACGSATMPCTTSWP